MHHSGIPLEHFPPPLLADVQEISACAEELNSRAYLVGGSVRDLLLGEEHCDLDVTVEGDGIALAEHFARRRGARCVAHRRFGTATVFVESHRKIDFATARKETYPQPGGLPQVTPSGIEDDLFRRDFTINALAVSLARERFGQLVDPFAGCADLEKRLIRVLHGQSFIDDPTRLLRAVRFAERLHFHLEPLTRRLFCEAARRALLEQVQPQRLRDELVLLLKERSVLAQLKRLKKDLGFGFIDPSLRAGTVPGALLRALKRECEWFRRVHPTRRVLEEWILYCAALLEARTPSRALRVCERMMFRAGETKRILGCLKLRRHGIALLERPGALPSAVYRELEPLSYEEVVFLKAAARSARAREYVAFFLQHSHGVRISLCGHDLAAWGLRPGPAYQKIFARVLNARLDGRVQTRDDELRLARRLVRALQ